VKPERKAESSNDNLWPSIWGCAILFIGKLEWKTLASLLYPLVSSDYKPAFGWVG